MESEGQQNSVNPSALIASLLAKRAKLHEDLRTFEKQGFDGNKLKFVVFIPVLVVFGLLLFFLFFLTRTPALAGGLVGSSLSTPGFILGPGQGNDLSTFIPRPYPAPAGLGNQDCRYRIQYVVYDMETAYLQDPSQCGSVLKGYEGFLSSSKSTSLYKRSRKFQPEDRLFSLSSVTSPANEEQAAMVAAPGMGPGKPKKGRPGPRRIRQYSEPDFDYEDDPDML